MSLSNSAIQTIATYYPNMRGEPRCQHALTIYLNAESMDDLNRQISQYSGRILHVTLHGGDVGRMEKNEHVDVFLTITGVTSIGYSAFYRCNSLEVVDLSNTQLTTIELGAFRDCKRLERVMFPKTLTKIEGGAFQHCSSLATLDLSNTHLRTIETWAFRGCNRLESVTFPNTLTRIGGGAFQDCENLVRAIFQNTMASIGFDAFSIRVKIIMEPFDNPALRF